MKEDVFINIGAIRLGGLLTIPKKSRSIVIFTHGSGSGRYSERNNLVANKLNEEGIATVLFDLLTEEEDEIYENRFDIPLLTKRLLAVTEWVAGNRQSKKLKTGFFGASTGAAAALEAAAELGEKIKAVVSRGGRPDMAMDSLGKVKSPTLLIVGGNDDVVIELNQKAYDTLACEKKLEIVPGATHLFEEPGCMEQVAGLAVKWFVKHL